MAARLDRSGRDRINAMLAQLDRLEIRVGVFEEARYEDGTPAAYVATIQELGYPEGGIPARPFLRPTFSSQRQAFAAQVRRGLQAVIDGRMALRPALEQVGQHAAGQVAATISQITTPPLAPATIAARKAKRKSPGVSTKPLVDSGLLLNSIDSMVVDA